MATNLLGLSCPDGGSFFICKGNTTEFIGCCTSDPCDGTGSCPQDDLRYSSFNSDAYDDLPTQDCDDGKGAQIWYTCQADDPPFMGCCTINPCDDASVGCPQSDLVAAKLSSNATNRDAFLKDANDEDTSTATSTASLTATSATTSTTASATTTSSSDGGSSGLSTGAIVGIAVAAGACAFIVLGILIWRCCIVPRRRQRGQPMRAVGGNEYQPQTPGSAGFGPQQSPHSHYSLASTPTAAFYPSGISSQDMQKYPSGWTPQQQQGHFDRPGSYNYTDSSGMTPNMMHTPQTYVGGHLHSPQEMDAESSAVRELGTGEDHQPSYHPVQQGENSPRASPNSLGIRS